MCENYDLFVIGETVDTYELYHIDLNSYKDNKIKGEENRLLFPEKQASIDKEFSYEDQDGEIRELKQNIMTGFHVKSVQADDDDELAENKITALFLYEGDPMNQIWIWQLGMNENKIQWVCNTVSTKLVRLDDERVIFREDKVINKVVERRENTQESDEDEEAEFE